ncbi:DUF3098 domain-containing protein [Chryseobacterium joostei]|uniref:DUF3098 domain-containing protein n=1 Tax=Chryseobacterium joostei TaxID=112234 RepID=A0A1N7IDH9_9FLAO|nr:MULTISPECIES: DUF3098 domain-containing protein [Chryseobacterium]AZB02034.1 DUF3098 domain-containing protein [Chryseobacterium joostei]SIS35127.1 Protein of unknown function [Chryseobacterium joostei]HCM36090.1 DUF3098 domain-containing protein [Chryseobacterium sp.]
MSKKINKISASDFGNEAKATPENAFYFGQQNFKWMLIGLAFIVVGFLLMMGPDANTVDGKFDPNSWNDGIFSIRRIRIAPLFVVIGFAIEVYAILKRK